MIDRSAISAVKTDRNVLENVLREAGGNVRGNSVRCPGHDDRHASGSIFEGEGAWLYRCHSPGCDLGKAMDAIGVVMALNRCGFEEACETLRINGTGPRPREHRRASISARSNGTNGQTKRRPDPAALREAERLADASHRNLGNDAATMLHLWRTRGIDAETAQRFGIGVTGDRDRRYWTFPVRENGELVGVKLHAADGQHPKGLWKPKNVATREHAWPVALEPPGPVWLCPGELKALAVIAVGRAAVGITSGENADLPARAIELLRGRDVAIVPDDDAAGHKWRDRVVRQLADAGIDVRVVDLGLDAASGRKDIQNSIVESLMDREPSAVAATLDDRYARSDPWRIFSIEGIWSDPRTWEPVEHIPTGFESLDLATHGGLRVGGVHLFVGRTGQRGAQFPPAWRRFADREDSRGHPAKGGGDRGGRNARRSH